MIESTVPYEHEGESFDAFVVRPESSGPHPVVLVFPTWAGRDAFAEEKARALAALGYVGVGVDLYGVGKRGTDADSSRALMSGLVGRPEVLRSRIARAHALAEAIEGADAQRMGAIGFCFGGLCSILSARMGLTLRGVVSFHGLLRIGAPLDAEVKARILVQHGQDDPMVPPEDVGAFAAEMKRIGAEWQLHAYPGVVHAFTNPKAADKSAGMAFDAYANRQSWLEMERFFADVFA